MKVARISARGQTVIPKSIREAAGLYAGDTLTFETDGEQVVVHKMPRGQDSPMPGLPETMREWVSAEDEEAWRDL